MIQESTIRREVAKNPVYQFAGRDVCFLIIFLCFCIIWRMNLNFFLVSLVVCNNLQTFALFFSLRLPNFLYHTAHIHAQKTWTDSVKIEIMKRAIWETGVRVSLTIKCSSECFHDYKQQKHCCCCCSGFLLKSFWRWPKQPRWSRFVSSL